MKRKEKSNDWKKGGKLIIQAWPSVKVCTGFRSEGEGNKEGEREREVLLGE